MEVQRVYCLVQREWVLLTETVEMLKFWSVFVGKKTCQSLDLNCSKVYERRQILWITRAYIPHAKVLRIRIGIIPLMLLRFLRLMAHNSQCNWQVLKSLLLCSMFVVFKALYGVLSLCLTWVWSMKSEFFLSFQCSSSTEDRSYPVTKRLLITWLDRGSDKWVDYLIKDNFDQLVIQGLNLNLSKHMDFSKYIT